MINSHLYSQAIYNNCILIINTFSPLENRLHEKSPGTEKLPLSPTYLPWFHSIPMGLISVSVRSHVSCRLMTSSVSSHPLLFASSLSLCFLSHPGDSLSSKYLISCDLRMFCYAVLSMARRHTYSTV